MHRFEAINVSYLLFEHKNDAKDCARAQANTHTHCDTHTMKYRKNTSKKIVFEIY